MMRAVNAPAVEVDGDDILFTQLKSASRFIIPEEIKSFSSVDAEVLIRIVTKSLELITGSKSEDPEGLPLNIASRHRICTALSRKVKENGFHGECGYNQLLYPVEWQTRALLVWIVSRLPRGEEIRASDNLEPASSFKLAISEKLTDWKSQPWGHYNSDGDHSPYPFNRHPFQSLPSELRNGGIFKIFEHSFDAGFSAANSVFENHSISSIGELEGTFTAEAKLGRYYYAKSSLSPDLQAESDAATISTSEDTTCGRPLTSKLLGVEPSHGSYNSDESNDTGAATVQVDVLDPDAEYARQLQEAEHFEVIIHEMETAIALNAPILKSLESRHIGIASEMKLTDAALTELCAESERLETTIQLKRDTLKLMSSAGENIIKLEDTCAAIILRITAATNESDAERAPNIEALQAMRKKKEKYHQKCCALVNEIKKYRDRIAIMQSELNEKGKKSSQLSRDVDEMPDALTRAAHTYRILDIMTSLDKQTNEIEKITCDIHAVQKTLNSTSRSLERADAVAEELIFLAASTDPYSHHKVESYRRLRALRLKFNGTIETVEKIGLAEKTARDLSTKIEEEIYRSSSDGFRQILVDLKEVQDENNELASKIDLLSSNLS